MFPFDPPENIKKLRFLPHDTQTYVHVSEGKKC